MASLVILREVQFVVTYTLAQIVPGYWCTVGNNLRQPIFYYGAKPQTDAFQNKFNMEDETWEVLKT